MQGIFWMNEDGREEFAKERGLRRRETCGGKRSAKERGPQRKEACEGEKPAKERRLWRKEVCEGEKAVKERGLQRREGCGSGNSNGREETADSGQMASESADDAPRELLKAVLLGDSQFVYYAHGNMEAIDITGVPALFDADDPYMKIFDFAMVDMDGDGEDEAVLFLAGAAGDMGGKVILHATDGEVYGYRTDNRTLEELKTDGTYLYSDPTGMAEAGIAAVTGFSGEGLSVDMIARASGTYEGWDTFTVSGRPVTEEEYRDILSRQEKKEDAKRYEFTEENIHAVF